MRLYAESSAVLAWLFGEPGGKSVHRELASAEVVIASDLTLVECDRALVRQMALGGAAEARVEDARAALELAASGWDILHLGSEVVARARKPFPIEPVRTLEAFHLSSALLARRAASGLAVVSLDDRIPRNARALGFHVLPLAGRRRVKT